MPKRDLTAKEAREALEVPSLSGDNVFTGTNHFDGPALYAARVGTDGDLTLFTTDIVTLEGVGGTVSSALDLTSLTTTGRFMTVPDRSGTIALYGDPITLPYVAKTGTYSAPTSDGIIECTSGTFTVTLPSAASIAGRTLIVKNSGAGVITIATTGGQTVDGAATATVAAGAVQRIASNGSNWLII